MKALLRWKTLAILAAFAGGALLFFATFFDIPLLQGARFQTAFWTPIAFYGRVLDQHDDPVPNAGVICYANDRPWKTGSEYHLQADGQGYFALRNAAGISLGVGVSKEGYLVIPPSDTQVTSSGVFDYGVGTRRHTPDQANPVIFRLHKLGTPEPLVKVGEKGVHFPIDGSPVSISVDSDGTHQVVLRCWNEKAQRPAGQWTYQFDWKAEVSVPDGGLTARKSAFNFEAPQEGYVPSDTIDEPVVLGGKWRSSVERSYFFRFADGTFARANLEIHPDGGHFVVWESFYNRKSGSTNLQPPAQSKK